METVEYCYTDTDNAQLDGIAKEIGEYLVGAYPGYGWSVTIKGGVVQLRSAKISHNWGMQIMLNGLQQDAGIRKKEIVMKAGEFLECANMRRNGWQGEYAESLEGRKDKNEFSPIISPLIIPT